MRALNVVSRMSILLYTALLVAGCTTAPKTADPRTMTFPPLKFDIPQGERAQLPNGMTVYIMEDRELPLVRITAYIRAGSIFDPADKVGLAELAGTVLRSGGTEATPPEKLNEELEFMASSIESVTRNEVCNVSMTTLTKNLDRTLELFTQVVMKPAFREDRFDLARKRELERIRRQNDDPTEIADRELQKALYPGHPLGREATGETVRKIGRADLAEFHRRFYRPGNIILAVSGDFTKAEMLERLGKAFASWENRPAGFPEVPQPTTDLKPEVLLARKSVSQSVIRMGQLGVDIRNPDLYALRVMNYILGGGSSSRLTTEIRANQGLAYDVGSYLDAGRRFVGTFTASTETKAESTAKAIALIREIIAGMTRGPVTDQELKFARESIVNSFIFSFTSSDAVVNQQVRLEYYNYPPGYLENYRDNIARVTKEDVLRVARKYLHPEAMILMVVGDEKKFDGPLSAFGTLREIKPD